MTRIEAGNLLMVGAGIIAALHTGLLSVWVSALTSNHLPVILWISIFGVIFIILNTIFWFLSRQKFQRELKNNGNEELLDPYMTAGLMLPYFIIIIAWILALNYSCELQLNK